jgi:uncharacterized protein (TIGR03000 family)
MYLRRSAALLLSAIVVGALGGGEAQAQTSAPTAPALPYSAYCPPGFIGNPYIAPYPGYGIMPLPFATYRSLYGEDLYSSKNATPPGTLPTFQMDYLPRVRGGLYPAVPYEKAPDTRPPGGAKDDVTRFRFEVTVPTADAVVLLNGAKTTQTGLRRTYVTPPLVADKHYVYTVEVQWTDDAGSRRTEKTSFDFLLGEPSKHLQFPLKSGK